MFFHKELDALHAQNFHNGPGGNYDCIALMAYLLFFDREKKKEADADEPEF